MHESIIHSGSAEEPAEEPKGSLQRQGTFSKEQEKEDHQTAELLEKLRSQSKRLLELEWELGCVRSDKEMLLSRSKCQEDELQELRATATVTNKMMGVSLLDNDSTHTHTHTHHHWWAVDASEYEVGRAKTGHSLPPLLTSLLFSPPSSSPSKAGLGWGNGEVCNV